MRYLKTVRTVLWTLVAVAALGAGALALGLFSSPAPAPQARQGVGIADIGGPFRLTTHEGKPFTDADLRGRPYLLFFGFLNCPDVCPTTLAYMTALYETLGKQADEIAMLLVTVDPERDTQQLLADYMEGFDPRFVALRGSAEETAAMIRTYRAHAEKVPLGDGNYTMDHTATVYMMDRNGRFVGSLDQHEDEAVKLAKLRRLLER